MKTTLITAVLLLSSSVAFGRGEPPVPVRTWPQPVGMTRSPDYGVSIDGKSVDVLITQVSPMHLPPGTAHPYSFATFEAEGEVTVEVTLLSTNVVWGEAKVLPVKLGAKLERTAPGKARIVLKAPCTAVFEPNGRHRALVLAIQPPERDAPKPGDRGVVYVGPGIHRRALTEVKSGETLYLAPGAVLEGGVRVSGDDVTVCGRGIVSGEPWAWQHGPELPGGKRVRHLFDATGRNLTIRDVLLTSSWEWTLDLNAVTNATVDNVKILCGRCLNDDGIDICRAKDVTVRNAFIRTQDDCVAVKWWCDGVLVTNCTLMVDFANAVRVGYECEAPPLPMRKVRMRDIDILHLASKKSSPSSYWGQSAFCVQASHGQTFENLAFEDIRIFATEQGNNFLVARTMPINPGFRYHKGFSFEEPGYVRDLVFRNVAVGGTARPAVYLEAYDASHGITGFVFENVTGCAEPTGNAAKRRVRVACIGDSITWGYAMTNRVAECYPAQLQRLLGDGYDVRNFGDSGSCVYFKPKRGPSGWHPHSWRWGHQSQAAYAFKPDIVVSNLGINDNEIFFFEYTYDEKGVPKTEPGLFRREYVALLRAFGQDGKMPRIIMWTKLAPLGKKHHGKGRPNPFVMSRTLQDVAAEVGAEGLDMYKPLVPYVETPDYAEDGVHPEGGAQRVIAEITARRIRAKDGEASSLFRAEPQACRELFNGKDLKGWHLEGGSATFTVENGEIVGRVVPDTPGNTFLCTDESFGDFALEVDWKLEKQPTNSGIQFRSATRPAKDTLHGTVVYGYQAEISIPKDRCGRIYDEGRRGFMNGLVWLDAFTPKERLEASAATIDHVKWNTTRIECRGQRIRTWVNGKPVVNLLDDASASGFIGLQVHAGKCAGGVRFRNIRLRTFLK